MEDIKRTISLRFAQKIYDVANYDTKELLENIFPKSYLEMDMDNMGKLVGSSNHDYEEITTVKWIKYIHQRPDKEISEELYNEINNLSDDTMVLLLWVEPRYDYYPRDYINGFYILQNRKESNN